MVNPRTTTRQQIQALLAKRRWSAHRLAKESGVAYQTVLDYLAGRTDTSTGKADAMIKALSKSAQ